MPSTRLNNHSKRHASFNSPREVPLPSPSLSQSQESTSPFFLDAHAVDMEPPSDPVSPSPEPAAFPPIRPFSLDDYLSTFRQQDSSNQTAWIDRHSSASLPAQSQIPFHALSNAKQSHPDSPPASPKTHASPPRCPLLHEESSTSSSSSSSSSDSSNSTAISSLHTDPSAAQKSPSVPEPPSSPEQSPTPDLPPPSVSSSSSSSARPISPFRAPQPPPPQPSMSAPAFSDGTAMRRFMTAAQLQSASYMSNFISTQATPPLSTPASASYPSPEPPVVLPAEPTDVTESEQRTQPPYMPFLSHVLPSPDSWIEVETTYNEYRLHVRLPGFSRESIMVTTKRRRILHVVADSWEQNGGGHFERRISFGYDADFSHIRAEFDGIMLRIIVPRRAMPVTWSSSPPRSASGRI